MKVQFDQADLAPLIEAAVAEAIRQIDETSSLIGGKLAIPEAEAARLLSMNPHQLRDERYEGRIAASVGRGGRILYSKNDLLNYLASRRWKRK
ncbi:MAG: hypothetical protein Tsb009_37250 [Planctomycetaceae bacterium]